MLLYILILCATSHLLIPDFKLGSLILSLLALILSLSSHSYSLSFFSLLFSLSLFCLFSYNLFSSLIPVCDQVLKHSLRNLQGELKTTVNAITLATRASKMAVGPRALMALKQIEVLSEKKGELSLAIGKLEVQVSS